MSSSNKQAALSKAASNRAALSNLRNDPVVIESEENEETLTISELINDIEKIGDTNIYISRNVIGESPYSKQIYDKLNTMEITHILNVDFLNYPSDKRFKILHYPFNDNMEENLLEKLYVTLSFIDDALSKHHKILVHCHAGISRSVSIVIAYLLWDSYRKGTPQPLGGIGEDEGKGIIDMVQRSRKKAAPNLGFRGLLIIFEQVLQELQEKKPIDITNLKTVCDAAIEKYKKIVEEFNRNKLKKQSGGFKSKQKRKTQRKLHSKQKRTQLYKK